MQSLLKLPDQGDVCSTGFLIFVLYGAGSIVAGRTPRLRQLSGSIAISIFLGYLLVRGIEKDPRNSREWAEIAFRGLLAAGLTYGIAMIVLPPLVFLYHATVTAPLGRIKWTFRAARLRRADARSQAADARRRAREQADLQTQAPEREAARLRAQSDAQARADAQRRRDDARAQAHLNYRLFAVKLGDKMFPKEEFEHYLQTFMADSQTPEVVERRGRELIDSYEQLLRDQRPPKPERSFGSLTAWYREQKSHIEGVEMDDIVRQTLLANLNERYQELLDQHLGDAHP